MPAAWPATAVLSLCFLQTIRNGTILLAPLIFYRVPSANDLGGSGKTLEPGNNSQGRRFL